MIYTIGKTCLYQQFFIEQGTPQKKGRTKDYSGGSVWATYEDAKQFLPRGYSVYGVLAEWDKDTIWEEGVGASLLIDADLVQLEEI